VPDPGPLPAGLWLMSSSRCPPARWSDGEPCASAGCPSWQSRPEPAAWACGGRRSGPDVASVLAGGSLGAAGSAGRGAVNWRSGRRYWQSCCWGRRLSSASAICALLGLSRPRGATETTEVRPAVRRRDRRIGRVCAVLQPLGRAIDGIRQQHRRGEQAQQERGRRRPRPCSGSARGRRDIARSRGLTHPRPCQRDQPQPRSHGRGVVEATNRRASGSRTGRACAIPGGRTRGLRGGANVVLLV
jgi:hypothetical protein